MKKIIAMALALVLVAGLSIGGTVAYFHSTDANNNTFTLSPGVYITLDEAPVDKIGDEYVADTTADRVKANEYEDVYPGAVMPKDPTVHIDVGSADTYVRAKVTLPNFFNWQTVYGNGFDPLNNFMALIDNTLGTGWEYVGYEFVNGSFQDIELTFVYNDRLTAGQQTTPLFTEFVMPATLTNETRVSYFGNNVQYINVVAEGIQAAGFDSALEAFAAYDSQLQ